MTNEIRERRDDDLPALARALVRVHARDRYPVEGVADPEGWLRHLNAIESWTAVDADGTTPIGQVTLTHATEHDDAARVWHEHTRRSVDELAIPVRLFVDPDNRRRGIGRRLMETAAAFAKDHGYAVAFDVVQKDRDAIRLYERLGARRLADIEHRFGDDGGISVPAAVYALP